MRAAVPLLLAALAPSGAAAELEQRVCRHDWLAAPDDAAARATLTSAVAAEGGDAAAAAPATLSLSNGLLERSFVTQPSFGTVELRNLRTGDSALRHIVPEAALTIDGVNYTLGGLYMADEPSSTGAQFTGQHAFLNRTGLRHGCACSPTPGRTPRTP